VAFSPKPLLDIQPFWFDHLQQWSLDGHLSAAAQEALILDGEPQALSDLTTQWAAGVFSALPPIVLLSSADINGALGAYAISTGTIYLNADWLAGASKEQVFSVLTEELGHHLDGMLNAVDTPGDEGEYFARMLGGKAYSKFDKNAMRTSPDTGTIQIQNTLTSVENASFGISPAWIRQHGTTGYETTHGVAVASDGKVWTTPVDQVIRVRTGERGSEAI
jgi:hypothetical protein